MGESKFIKKIRKEIIKVRGQKDIVENIAMTVFGPVMYDQHFPNPLHNGKYYAVRWKAHDASNEMLMFNKLNHAKSYNDYYAAICKLFKPMNVPSSGDWLYSHKEVHQAYENYKLPYYNKVTP